MDASSSIGNSTFVNEDILKSSTRAFLGLINEEQLQLFHKCFVGFWLAVAVSGCYANFTNIRIFLRMSRDESITISFLAMSMSDFMVCLFNIAEALTSVVEIVQQEFLMAQFYIPPAIVIFFIIVIHRVFTVLTISITTLIAVQRCLCVIIPFHIKGMFTPRGTYLFMIVTVLIPCIIYTTYFSMIQVREIVIPQTNTTMRLIVFVGAGTSVHEFIYIFGGVFNVGTQVLVIASLIGMVYGLNKSLRFRKSASSVPNSKGNEQRGADNSDTQISTSKETQALIQVSLISLMYVVSNTPYMALLISRYIEPEINTYKRYHNLSVVLFYVVLFSELLNSSLNFIFYYKYNSNFRKLLKTKD